MPRVGERSRAMPGTGKHRARSWPQPLRCCRNTRQNWIPSWTTSRSWSAEGRTSFPNSRKRIQKQQGLILMSRINRLAKSTADLARRVSQTRLTRRLGR